MTTSDFVREIFLKLDKEEKKFLDKIYFSNSQLEREVNNYKKYLKNEKINSKRTSFGEIAYDQSLPVGYISFTNFENVNPNKYEKNFIKLISPLNYIHCKRLVVDPDFRNRRIGTQLINTCLDFAKKYEKKVVGDVKINNKKMISLLESTEFIKEKEWITPKGVEMIRYFHK